MGSHGSASAKSSYQGARQSEQRVEKSSIVVGGREEQGVSCWSAASRLSGLS